MSRVIEDWPADAEPVPPAAGRVYFDAVLRPNRSLTNVGFWALMGAVLVMSFSAGLFYVAIGAWPVLGFFGLDVAAIWLAFRLSYRQGRLAETVRVTAARTDVRRVHPSGHVTHWSTPTAWARVSIDRPVRHDSQVRLRAHGRTLVLGAFLAPDERGTFADALAHAIAAAREERLPGGAAEPQGSGGAG